MTCPLCGSLSLAVPSRSGHPPGNVERRDSGQPSIHARLVAKLEAWMTDTHDPMLPVLQGRDSPAIREAFMEAQEKESAVRKAAKGKSKKSAKEGKQKARAIKADDAAQGQQVPATAAFPGDDPGIDLKRARPPCTATVIRSSTCTRMPAPQGRSDG